MIWEGMEVRSRTDFNLGTDCRLFSFFSVQDPRHNSDHYMVMGCVHSASLRENARYLGGSKRPPPPHTDRTDEGGQNLRGPTEGRPKTAGSGSSEKRVDLGDNVETCGCWWRGTSTST